MSGVKHGFGAEVIERDANGRGITWLGTCGQHEKFVGPSYEVIEDKWRQHVHAETGVAPKPMGDVVGRWMP